jgi:DNA topoisomerase-1
LFKLPRKIGEFEGKEMIVAVGRFGPYVRHDGSFYSLQKEDDPMSITAERGIELITLKREADKNKLIAVLGDKEEYKVLNGRYGPYFTFEKKNYKIPKSIDPQTLTAEQCKELVEKQGKTKTRTKRTKGK